MPGNLSFISTLRELQLKNAYIVGGTVRDILIGKIPVDVDIVVQNDTERIARDLADKIGGSSFYLDKQRGILRVISYGKSPPDYYDILPLRDGNIYADLSLRDFTIDALAISLADIETIIDPFNGREDIKERLIRVISRKSFEDDPLRMLRAFRLASTLGFRIEDNTLNIISELAPTLRFSASERIRDEFFRILAFSNSTQYLRQIHNSGLLKEILSGIAENDIEKGLISCEKLEELYNSMHNIYTLDHVSIKDYFTTKVESGIRNIELWKLLSLYINSNINKPKMIEAVEKLRLSNRAAKMAILMIEQRNNPILDKGVNDKKLLYRFFKNSEDNGLGFIFFCLASTGLNSEIYDNVLRNSKDTISWFFHVYKKVRENPLITGEDIKKLFNIPPGQVYRSLLDLTEENQVMGYIMTKKDAVSFLKKVVTNF